MLMPILESFCLVFPDPKILVTKPFFLSVSVDGAAADDEFLLSGVVSSSFSLLLVDEEARAQESLSCWSC